MDKRDMKLQANRVTEIFKACLFKEGEPTDKMVVGNGVVMKAGFHPERLEQHRQEITNMIMELHPNFRKSVGGGWSFLAMCQDAEGRQWADTHKTMDELLVLGDALGLMRTLFSKDMWENFAGGMPYIQIDM